MGLRMHARTYCAIACYEIFSTYCCIKLSILCTTHVFAVQSNTYAGPVCMCDPGSSSAQVLNPIIFAVMVQAKVEPTHTTSHTSSHEYLTSIVPDVCQPKLNLHRKVFDDHQRWQAQYQLRLIYDVLYWKLTSPIWTCFVLKASSCALNQAHFKPRHALRKRYALYKRFLALDKRYNLATHSHRLPPPQLRLLWGRSAHGSLGSTTSVLGAAQQREAEEKPQKMPRLATLRFWNTFQALICSSRCASHGWLWL